MQNLILLHGALGHPQQMKNFSELLKQDFKVYSLLFLGHGGCQAPEYSLTVSSLVRQLEAFILQENIENPLVFGYSLGGYVALRHAIDYPGKIKSIITLATKFAWSESIAEDEIKFLNPNTIREKVPKYADYLSETHGSNQWEHLLRNVAFLLKDIGKKLYLNPETLEKINIPVKVIVGDRDNMVTIQETKWANEFIPHSTIEILTDTAHPFEKVDVALLLNLTKDFFMTSPK